MRKTRRPPRDHAFRAGRKRQGARPEKVQRELPGPDVALEFDLRAEEDAALRGAIAPLVSPQDLTATIDLFRSFLGGLVAWNIRSNLVAAGDRDRLVRRHVAESLACVPWIDAFGGSRLIDLGSGGGFPGIPIKLVRPSLEVTLIESRRMKSLFLRRTIAALGLRGIAVWQARVETVAALPRGPDVETTETPGAETDTRPEPTRPPTGLDPDELSARPVVDLVTSRAVASLGVTTRWVAPLVHPGGALVTFKGSRVDDEIRAWEADPGPWELARIEREVLPGLTLVALRKLAKADSS